MTRLFALGFLLFAGGGDPSGWEKIATGGDALYLGAAFFDAGTGVIVGGTKERAPSVIRRTTDGGKTWTAPKIDARGRLYAVDFPTSRRGYAVGYSVIVATDDGGQTWRSVGLLEDRWLAGVDFVTESIGFVVGGHGSKPVFWKTEDGGKSWKSIVDRIPEDARDSSLRSIRFRTPEHGFAVGTDGVILETRDGGEHWVRRPSGVDAWLRSIRFVGDHAFIAGAGVFLRSDDRGRTWSAPTPGPGRRKLNDAVFITDKQGWITDFAGEILATEDGGATWTVVHRHRGTPTVFDDSIPGVLFLAADGGWVYRCAR